MAPPSTSAVRTRRRTPPTDQGSGQKPPPRRALQLDVPEAKLRVKRTVYGQDTEREEIIEVPAFHGPVAYVRVGGSVTKNLGDYNSAKVEVSISLPCYPTPEEIERTFRTASMTVDSTVTHELDVATGKKNPEDPL